LSSTFKRKKKEKKRREVKTNKARALFLNACRRRVLVAVFYLG
jgi:hypothetical protein